MSGLLLTTPVFPSIDGLEPAVPDGGVGVAISGGGTRSLAASMGHLRALRQLGLLDRVWGISAASGGAWLSIPWTWLPSHIDDTTFLGEYVADPGQLRWLGSDGPCALGQIDPLCAGAAATRMGPLTLFESAERWLHQYDLRPDELWCRVVAEAVLAPFGLADVDVHGSPTRTLAWDEATWRADVAAFNPGDPDLSLDRFQCVERARPWPIVAMSVVPHQGRASLWPLEVTARTARVPGLHARRAGYQEIGGGAIPTFALGSSAATEGAWPSSVGALRPAAPFSLGELAGITSISFGEALVTKLQLLSGIEPRIPLWPAVDWNEARNTTRAYLLSDGGNLEDTAVVPLLRRPSIRKIVAFVNSMEPLRRDPKTQQIVLDAQVAPLFGLQPHAEGVPYMGYPHQRGVPLLAAENVTWRGNQVFPESAFFDLCIGLDAAAATGGATLFWQRDLPVLDNTLHAVTGGRTVDVLWVYNHDSAAWRARLGADVRIGMALDPRFGSFPYYNTVTQMHLVPRQINLLASLGAWSVGANADLFRRFFDA